jgi:hypothetical protein
MIRFRTSVLLLALSLSGVWSILPAYAEDAAKADAGDGKSEADKKSDKKPEGDAKKGPDDVSGGRFVGDPIYIHMAPFVMPIINENGTEQIVTLALDIQVSDFNTADDMHTFMPKVRDAIMTGLYGGLGDGALRNGKLVNIAKIKAKAISSLRAVIPGDKITDVLVQGVAQRTF